MRIKDRLNLLIITAMALIIIGCEPSGNEETTGIRTDLEFTELKALEVSGTEATIRVEHNGTTEDSWYGFHTDDITSPEIDLMMDKVSELLEKGSISGLSYKTATQVYLTDLTPEKRYRYIAFAITPEGEPYGKCRSVTFTTEADPFLMTETDDWKISHSRDPQTNNELFGIECDPNKYYRFEVFSKNYVELLREYYPDGIEMAEGKFVEVLDALMIFEIIEVQEYYFNLNDYTLIQERFDAVVNKGTGEFNYGDRLAAGEYILAVYGFKGNGEHTGFYQTYEFEIEEEATASPEYEKWIGKYELKGKTKDYETEEFSDLTYTISVKYMENNYLYEVSGWECDGAANSITEMFPGSEITFPAYFKDGKLTFREQTITPLTFSGDETVYTLGHYGYCYIEDNDQDTPWGDDSATMAEASWGEEDGKAIINGLTVTEGEDTWTYLAMGYVYHSGDYINVFNTPMYFPIEMTRIADSSESALSMAHNSRKGDIRDFESKASKARETFRNITLQRNK